MTTYGKSAYGAYENCSTMSPVPMRRRVFKPTLTSRASVSFVPVASSRSVMEVRAHGRATSVSEAVPSRRLIRIPSLSRRVGLPSVSRRRVLPYGTRRVVAMDAVPSQTQIRQMEHQEQYVLFVSPVHSKARIYKEG